MCIYIETGNLYRDLHDRIPQDIEMQNACMVNGANGKEWTVFGSRKEAFTYTWRDIKVYASEPRKGQFSFSRAFSGIIGKKGRALPIGKEILKSGKSGKDLKVGSHL